MKLDTNEHISKGTQRNLSIFTQTLIDLCTSKSFESITVNELCEKGNFPRSTFYNYFDDKFDLLNYYWTTLTSKINLSEHKKINSCEIVPIFYDRIYYLFSKNHMLLNRILRHNPIDSELMDSFNAMFHKTMRVTFVECLDYNNQDIPISIIASHFSNTFLLILQECFMTSQPISQDDGKKYLETLLKDLI